MKVKILKRGYSEKQLWEEKIRLAIMNLNNGEMRKEYMQKVTEELSAVQEHVL